MITGLTKHPSIVRSFLAAEAASRSGDELSRAKDVATEEDFELFKQRFFSANAKLLKETVTQGIRRIEGVWEGSYDVAPLPIASMRVSMLPWHNFSGMAYGLAGCGNIILGQITGANPWEINLLMKDFIKEFCARPENKHLATKDVLAGGYIPSEFMMTFFSLHGIHMFPLSVRDVCPNKRLIENPITKNHVVLVALHVAANEQTWAVIFQNKLWHGTDVQPLDPLEFINNPISEAYLLYNPSWKVSSKRVAELMDLGGDLPPEYTV